MPCESGDLAKRIRIKIITRHGKRSTRPSGIETDESPFSRIRRRKKGNRGDAFSAGRDMSSDFFMLSLGDGSLLVRSCMNPIVKP